MRFISNTIVRVKQQGILATMARAWGVAQWRMSEWRLGVKTSGDIAADKLGHGDQQFGYQPIDPRSLQMALDWLKPDGSDVFVDMGCGLGRAMLIAAKYPFARVMGVEYSRELYVSAHRNSNRAASRLGRSMQAIHGDATSWQFPADVTVVFLFNPFQGDKLADMLGNLKRSIAKSPRTVHIVYSLPKFDDDLLARCEWLKAVRHVQTPNPDWERLTIYQGDLDVACRVEPS